MAYIRENLEKAKQESKPVGNLTGVGLSSECQTPNNGLQKDLGKTMFALESLTNRLIFYSKAFTLPQYVHACAKQARAWKAR